MTDLKDKIVIITGASSGIGKAMARLAADHGAVVCVVGRNYAGLREVAIALGQKASDARVYTCDLTSEKEIGNLAASITKDWGRADLLIHSAGIIMEDKFSTSQVHDLKLQYEINLRAPFLLTQALLPELKRSQGQIVFMNSSIWLNAGLMSGHYAATKYGLKAMADSLRAEVNPDGVRVLSIFPGRVNTPMQQTLLEDNGEAYNPERLLQPEDVATIAIHALTLPRTAEVTEIHIRQMLKH
jgi:NADP-dependent 3-hydroxy acid dehydrogenase YdfG